MTRKQFLAAMGSAFLSIGIAKLATMDTTISAGKIPSGGKKSQGYGNSAYGGAI